MPCFLFYSRFDKDSDHLFALSLIAFMVLGMFISIYKWIQFDLLIKKRELYEDKKKKYSKLFFNMWDWRTANTNFEGRSLATGIRVELKTNLDEDRIKAEIDKRTAIEKSKLFIRRLSTLVVNIILLILGWGGIIAISIYNKDIQSKLSGVKYVKEVSKFVPPIALTVINAIVEIGTKQITTLEAWDFKEQMIQQQVWRKYFAKFMNLTVTVVIQAELISNTPWFLDDQLQNFNEGITDATKFFSCREDQVS